MTDPLLKLARDAKAARAYRKRRTKGTFCTLVEVTPEAVEFLEYVGHLRPEDAEDRDAIGAAIEAHLAQLDALRWQESQR